VSNAGSDSNPGTQALPLRTLAAGYAKLRDGTPDQVLLRRGDTFNESIGWAKASGDPAHKMVCGAYGTGPCPRVVGGGFYLGQQSKRGLLFVDLDVVAPSMGGATNGFVMFAPWADVTIEGCYIWGFYVNCAAQEIDTNRLSNLKFRRTVFADAGGGSGHNQLLFTGAGDGNIYEENVFDRGGNVPGFEKNDLYCHGLYAHQTNGSGIFRGNITARNCSHGVQLRSGSVMENNLAINNPIGLYIGDGSGLRNSHQGNVCVDSRDISPQYPRGFGHWMDGAGGLNCVGNIAFKNTHGSSNCEAIHFDGVVGGVVTDNFVFDWPSSANSAWGHCFNGGGIATFVRNQAYQPSGGQCVHDFSATTKGQNRYWSTSSLAFNDSQTWAQWQAGESGSTFADPGPKDLSIAAYLTHCGVAPTADPVDQFMLLARNNRKHNWDDRWTANSFNRWARGIAGIAEPTWSV